MAAWLWPKATQSGSKQIFAGWVNPKNGRGYAECSNPKCDAVEELGIDRWWFRFRQN
jgi:hypothetical protein